VSLKYGLSGIFGRRDFRWIARSARVEARRRTTCTSKRRSPQHDKARRENTEAIMEFLVLGRDHLFPTPRTHCISMGKSLIIPIFT
jgi:hypothetical protein